MKILRRRDFVRMQELLAAGWLRPNGVTAYQAASECGWSRSTWRRTLNTLLERGWANVYEKQLPNGAVAHVFYLSADAISKLQEIKRS